MNKVQKQKSIRLQTRLDSVKAQTFILYLKYFKYIEHNDTPFTY